MHWSGSLGVALLWWAFDLGIRLPCYWWWAEHW